MKLKNTNRLAIELATCLKYNKLSLHGNSTLDGIIEGVHVGATNIENTFLYIYDVDTQFFYSASVLCKDRCKFTEVGIGHIELDGANPILHRDKFLYHQRGEDTNLATKFDKLECTHLDESVIVTSYSPKTMHELLYTDNCLITSMEPHTPSVTHIDKNSLLLRLDGDLESVSIDNAVKELLCKYTKQLVLKSPRLDVKTLSTQHIIIKTSKPLKKKGEVYYDEEENALKFYDGNSWRVIV